MVLCKPSLKSSGNWGGNHFAYFPQSGPGPRPDAQVATGTEQDRLEPSFLIFKKANFDNEDNQGKEEAVKVTKRNFGRFYPTVRERTARGLTYPTMLTLSCNAVEVVRLRHTLLMTLEQAIVLEEVFLR